MASASQIRTIYSTLATKTIEVASSVAYGTKTPQIFDLDELPAVVESAQLPARLLLPFGVVGSKAEGRDHHFIALGTTTKVQWQVVDLLLWRPVEEGIGIESVSADMVTYCAQYIKMIRENRSLGLSQVEIIGANFETDAYEYPPQSEIWFWGVLVTLQINETLSG